MYVPDEPRSEIHLRLAFAAPYIAVVVCWFGLRSALLAILVYHGLILLLAGGRLPFPEMPRNPRHLLLALPALAAGPLLYLLIPFLIRMPISTWLSERHFPADMLLYFLPYFGLIHPWIEQAHWRPLREHTAWAHPLFAGYHLLVLFPLVRSPGLLVAFAGLTLVSYFWDRLTRHAGNLLPAYLSHALADTGIVLAAYYRL